MAAVFLRARRKLDGADDSAFCLGYPQQKAVAESSKHLVPVASRPIDGKRREKPTDAPVWTASINSSTQRRNKRLFLLSDLTNGDHSLDLSFDRS